MVSGCIMPETRKGFLAGQYITNHSGLQSACRLTKQALKGFARMQGHFEVRMMQGRSLNY